MRTALVLSLFAAATLSYAFGSPKFAVVVHTSEQVVARYVCGQSPLKEPIVVKTELRKRGLFNWHVVGGVAPFTIVKDEMAVGNTRCITVMDATGEMATACGIINTREEIQEVDCRLYNARDSLVFGLVPDAASDSARLGLKAPLGESPGQEVEPYHPPVKQPINDPPAPKPIPNTPVDGDPLLEPDGGNNPPKPVKPHITDRTIGPRTGNPPAPTHPTAGPTGGITVTRPAPTPPPSPRPVNPLSAPKGVQQPIR